jgi:hypothetical protein
VGAQQAGFSWKKVELFASNCKRPVSLLISTSGKRVYGINEKLGIHVKRSVSLLDRSPPEAAAAAAEIIDDQGYNQAELPR